mgnify:CR=1 FL=1
MLVANFYSKSEIASRRPFATDKVWILLLLNCDSAKSFNVSISIALLMIRRLVANLMLTYCSISLPMVSLLHSWAAKDVFRSSLWQRLSAISWFSISEIHCIAISSLNDSVGYSIGAISLHSRVSLLFQSSVATNSSLLNSFAMSTIWIRLSPKIILWQSPELRRLSASNPLRKTKNCCRICRAISCELFCIIRKNKKLLQK